MSCGTDWDPEQYLRFQREREQPWRDLLALVRPRPGMRIADLGCGPGALTLELHQALAAKETAGVDSSAAMLERARAHVCAGVRFVHADLAHADLARLFEDGSPAAPRLAAPLDLIFSNAALHWLPEHGRLLTRLSSALAPGGQLAVQVPDNEAQPSHQTAREVAMEPAFKRALGGYVRRSPVLQPEEYAAWLHRLGYVEQHVRAQLYTHLLPSRAAVVEWVKGSLLTDYQRRLAPEVFAQFVARYRTLLVGKLADDEPFFFTFRRLLIWGVRPG